MTHRRRAGDDPATWAPLGPPRWEPDVSTQWMYEGECVTEAALPWTPEERPTTEERRLMRALCAACPVRDECAAFAVEQGVTWGFWAGRWVEEYTVREWRWYPNRRHYGWAA